MTSRELIFLVALLFHFKFSPASAQEIINIDTKFHEFGPYCEGQIFEIGSLDEISCFHIKSGTRNCISYEEYIAEDKSENIRITGATPVDSKIARRYTLDGKNYINVWSYKFKAEQNTKIVFTLRSLIEVIIPDGCNTSEKTYIQERVYTYNIKVVQKPPTPSLTVERYISANAVNFIASGCPTDQEGYDYKWNGSYCIENAGNSFGTGNKGGTLTGPSNTSFRVLCSALNGLCLSEPTGFVKGLSYTSPDFSKIPDEHKEMIATIESIRKSSRLDYHNYKVETAICERYGANQSVCNVQTVFQLMLESKEYIAPIASDIPYNSFESNERFGIDATPVNSYEITNLPGVGVDFLLGPDWGIFQPFINNLINNPILTYIDYSNYSIINYTLSGHLLKPGRIIRQVVQECDKIKIITIGEGQSAAGDNFVGKKFAKKKYRCRRKDL